MPSNTFTLFPLLPKELRTMIWHYSMPTIITAHIQEGADIDVTRVSSPPGQALACKEARTAYLSSGYAPYSIYTAEGDWADIHVNQASTIQLVITPSSSKNLNITWTELSVLLHAALPLISKLHIVCSQPARLVRLFGAPEAGLVHPGQTHWGEEMYGKEVCASEREVRESLNPGLRVSTSTAMLEELGPEGTVEEWEVVRERVVEGFGHESAFGTSVVLRRVGCGEESREVQVWEEMLRSGGEENGGEELTEKAIARFTQETGWTPRSSTPSSIYSGDEEMYYDGELWLSRS
jgi:hypothetical protein